MDSRRRALLSLLALSALPARAAGEPVRLVVPFPAGGGGDVLARSVADALGEALGVRIWIDNRPGAGGTIGTRAVANAKGDGRTLGYVTNGILCVNEFLYPEVVLKPRQDLKPVGGLSRIGLMAVIHPGALPGVKNLESLIDYARAHPGKVNFGSSGNGTTSHLAGLYFSQLTGTKLTHIPYRGGAASIVDLLAGRIPFLIDVIPNVISHVRAGKLIALGVSTPERSGAAPEVPTLDEAGIRGFSLAAWDGFVLPASAPDETAGRFSSALREALGLEQVRRSLALKGAEPNPMTPGEFRDFISSEAPKWQNLVETLRAQVD